MNNAFNVFTEFISCELMYDFKIKNKLIVLSENISGKLMTNSKFEKFLKKTRLRYKQKAIDIVTFNNAKTKIMYDRKHKSFLMKKKTKSIYDCTKNTSSQKNLIKILKSTMRPFFNQTTNRSSNI